MRPRLVLHAGTHKTGTTSIQQTLAAHRDELRDQGVWYPDPRPWWGGNGYAQHGLAHAAATDLTSATSFIEHIAAEVRPGETVLLSSEAVQRRTVGVGSYWDQRFAYLSAVANLLEPFQVEVVLYFRRRDTHAESMFKSTVLKGVRVGGFLDFVHQRLRTFDYNRQVEALRAVFPSVEVRSYDSSQPIVVTFLQRLGVSLPEAGGTWAHSSVDPRIAMWLATQPAEGWKQQRAFALSPAGQALFPREDLSLWPSAEARDQFLGRWQGEFGSDWFPTPGPMPPPAVLADGDRREVDDAYQRWSHASAAPLEDV